MEHVTTFRAVVRHNGGRPRLSVRPCYRLTSTLVVHRAIPDAWVGGWLSGGPWTVSHEQTGMMFGRTFDTRQEAAEFGLHVAERVPEVNQVHDLPDGYGYGLTDAADFFGAEACANANVAMWSF